MYHAFYLYRVSREHIERFLRIAATASLAYRGHGAVASVTMRITDGDTKYGLLGLGDLVRPTDGEELFLGIDSFWDAEQFRAVMPQIDADPQIAKLYREIQEVIDLQRVVRWEADDVG